MAKPEESDNQAIQQPLLAQRNPYFKRRRDILSWVAFTNVARRQSSSKSIN